MFSSSAAVLKAYGMIGLGRMVGILTKQGVNNPPI